MTTVSPVLVFALSVPSGLLGFEVSLVLEFSYPAVCLLAQLIASCVVKKCLNFTPAYLLMTEDECWALGALFRKTLPTAESRVTSSLFHYRFSISRVMLKLLFYLELSFVQCEQY